MDANDLFPRERVLSIESSDDCSCVLILGSDYRLTVESLWRLRNDGSIVLTSRDNGQRFGHDEPVDAIAQLRSALVGAPITKVAIGKGTSDLSLTIGNYLFEVITDSSGYESWQVWKADTVILVAQGGGTLFTW